MCGNRATFHIWRMAPLCLLWNARSFEDRETSLLDLKKLVLHSLFTWRVALVFSPVSTFSEFLNFCSSFSIS
jgi:hypothetical protein